MTKEYALMYLNNTLKIPHGHFTAQDAQVLSQHVHIVTNKYISPDEIISAARGGNFFKYLDGLKNALIKKFGITFEGPMLNNMDMMILQNTDPFFRNKLDTQRITKYL